MHDWDGNQNKRYDWWWKFSRGEWDIRCVTTTFCHIKCMSLFNPEVEVEVLSYFKFKFIALHRYSPSKVRIHKPKSVFWSRSWSWSCKVRTSTSISTSYCLLTLCFMQAFTSNIERWRWDPPMAFSKAWQVINKNGSGAHVLTQKFKEKAICHFMMTRNINGHADYYLPYLYSWFSLKSYPLNACLRYFVSHSIISKS